MVDDATNSANLASAENLIKINLGLDGIDPSDWTSAQMTQYLQGLSAEIVANPSSFNSQTVTNAQNIGSTNLNDLANIVDSDPTVSDYWSALQDASNQQAGQINNLLGTAGSAVSNLVNAVGNAAKAVSNTASAAQWLLPAAAILLVVFLAQSNKVSAKGFSLSR